MRCASARTMPSASRPPRSTISSSSPSSSPGRTKRSFTGTTLVIDALRGSDQPQCWTPSDFGQVNGVDLPLVTVLPTVAESPTAVAIMRCAAWAVPEWSSSSGWWVIGRRLSGAVGAEPQPGSQASSADSSPLRSRSRTRSPYGLQLRPDCIHSSNVGAAEDVGENPSRTMHSWITTNPS
jgi:hypothetical protein